MDRTSTTTPPRTYGVLECCFAIRGSSLSGIMNSEKPQALQTTTRGNKKIWGVLRPGRWIAISVGKLLWLSEAHTLQATLFSFLYLSLSVVEKDCRDNHHWSTCVWLPKMEKTTRGQIHPILEKRGISCASRWDCERHRDWLHQQSAPHVPRV